MKKGLLFLVLISFFLVACDAGELKESYSGEETSQEHFPPATNGQPDNMQNSLAELKREIEILMRGGNQIGPDHYETLKARLAELEREGVAQEEIDALDEKIEHLGNLQSQPENQQGEEAHQPVKAGLLSPRGCEGSGSFMLGAPPLALEDIQKILPMGGVSTVHITPTDHQYWHTIGYSGPADDTENLGRFKVYAPAGGYIVEIEKGTDHRIVIEHSCTFYTIFIHVDKLSENIQKEVNFKEDTSREHAWPRIQVKEGEVIGTIGIGKLDFSVVDQDVTLGGFVNPESYQAEPWKIHTVDTFDYYKEPLKSWLLAKNLRKAEPLGGKIDYDVNGKLAGNWFIENTGGYKGLGNEQYWTSHLSIVYDSLDPDHIVISMGAFDGQSAQYGVKNNEPKPEDVDVDTGMVKYELAPYDFYVDNKKWDGIAFVESIEAKNTEEIRGVALFQVISGQKLKAEFFPGKAASEVSGFTSNAVMYER